MHLDQSTTVFRMLSQYKHQLHRRLGWRWASSLDEKFMVTLAEQVKFFSLFLEADLQEDRCIKYQESMETVLRR